jgi:hypothetical protein
VKDYESIVAFPDIASAQLLREVLVDGGLEDVEIHTVPTMAYMPRAQTLDYEVRVPVEDRERARLLLRDYQAESELAANAQSGASSDDAAPPVRSKWVLRLALGALVVMLIGPAISVAIILVHFIRQLF